MVAMFSVTSSPTTPSPRVEPRTSCPHAVFQADRQAVDLGLDDIFRLNARFADAGIELPQLVKGESIL